MAYKAEASDLQRQLRHLQAQFDMLTSQASTLTQGRRPRVGATSIVNGHLTTIDDNLSVRNLQVLSESLSHKQYIWMILCSKFLLFLLYIIHIDE